MRIEDELEIGAPPERVWQLTVDVERWPDLTPTMVSVERLDDGPIMVGSRARVKQPAQPSAVWTVTELEPGHRFVWSTELATITMTGRHEISASADGCRNRLGLDLDGFGSGRFGRLFGGRIREAIATENRGFRHAAESP